MFTPALFGTAIVGLCAVEDFQEIISVAHVGQNEPKFSVVGFKVVIPTQSFHRLSIPVGFVANPEGLDQRWKLNPQPKPKSSHQKGVDGRAVLFVSTG